MCGSPKELTYTLAAPTILACFFGATSTKRVATPEKPSIAVFWLVPARITRGLPPALQEPARADLSAISVSAPVEAPSVGAATRPEANPGVVAVAFVVAMITFAGVNPADAVSEGPAIQDSMPAHARPVAEPPALEAWLVTSASSISRFSSLSNFVARRPTSDRRPAFWTTSMVPETRNSLFEIWQ